MKKRCLLLVTIIISITFFSADKIEAAVASWIGDHCTSCGRYGAAGDCDNVKETNVGLFRVTFYLNDEKIGSSVNISSSEIYQNLASNASYHWNEGKTDIVSYANGTASLSANSGGIKTIIVPGITTANVQRKLSPKLNSATVQKILTEAQITNFSFKNGKIIYKPSDVASSDDTEDCEDKYQIQMVVEAMQVINWLCTSDGEDSFRWVGTPYELYHGLRANGYESSTIYSNGWYSGSVVDRDLLNALRLDQDVKIGGVQFYAVTDCLTRHIRQDEYVADKGYGINVYNLKGEIEIDCGEPPEDDKCEYVPDAPFNEECCDDAKYLEQYYTDHTSTGPENFMEVCCDIDEYKEVYSTKIGGDLFDDYHKEFCEPETECKPINLTGKASCNTATCENDINNVSEFKDPIFNTDIIKKQKLINDDGSVNLNLGEEQLKDIASLYEDNSFIAVAKQGETYKQEITYDGRANRYCNLYCQEIATITLPDFYPAANAGRYFQWYISTEEGQPFIKQQVTRICAEDIKLDDFMEEYYEWMKSVQEKVDVYTNANMGCGSGPGPVYNYKEAVNGVTPGDTKCEWDYGCCMRSLPCTPTPCVGSKDHPVPATCLASLQACIRAIQQHIAGCQEAQNVCLNGQTVDGVKEPPFRDKLTEWKDNFADNPETFSASFEEFLGCFDPSLGQEIETNLQFELDAGDIGDYFSGADFDNILSGKTSPAPSDTVCVDGTDCDDSYYSYKPQIDDYSDDSKTMTCKFDYWASTDLLNKGVEVSCSESKSYAQSVSENCRKRADNSYCDAYHSMGEEYVKNCKDGVYSTCVAQHTNLYNPPTNNLTADSDNDGKVSLREKCEYDRERCYSEQLRHQQNFKNPGDPIDCEADPQPACTFVKNQCDGTFGYNLICSAMPSDVYIQQGGLTCTINTGGKIRRYSVPNFVENRNIDYNNFPLTVNAFDSQSSTNSTNGWNILETAEKYNKNKINWFKTFRLLAQTKTDEFILNEGINSCVCNDGSVGNLIFRENADPNAIVSGDAYCDCDPEVSANSYSEMTTGVGDVEYEQNEEWGKCKYSAYTTIREGGNYSVKYMSGSGTYPLSIYYWNIGSIDPDGDAHFNDMLDNQNCCLGGICEYSGEDGICKLFIGNAIMTDSWSNEHTDWWDLSASYYVCKNGECTPPPPPPPPPCPECPPPEPDPNFPTGGDDPIIPDEETCPNGNCPNPDGLAIIYRTIDLNNPFPDNRKPGANWQDKESLITNNRGVDGSELYSSKKPLYKFKFTPDVIKDIRNFNNAYGRDYASSSTIAYPGDPSSFTGIMTYEDGDKYYSGISQVLNNVLAEYFAEAAANNGDDLEGWFDVPLYHNCAEWYKDNADTAKAYCEQIGDTYRIVSGDPDCWAYASPYINNTGGGEG